MWSFQYRVTTTDEDDRNRWRYSAKHFEKAEDAAAAVAHCQSVLVINGIMLECRLVPHQLQPPSQLPETSEVTHPIGFKPTQS